MTRPNTVVFDIGGVLLDWNPRYLYYKLIPDEVEREYFLTHICSQTWNLMQDAGRPFTEGIAELSARHPQHSDLIGAFFERWEETISGAFDDTVAVLHELKRRGTPLYAITNFNHETFALCQRRYGFLNDFIGIIVSAEVKLLKPDPAIYLRLLHDYGLAAGDCVFIDDSEVNTRGAERVGMHGIHYRNSSQLRTKLTELELLSR